MSESTTLSSKMTRASVKGNSSGNNRSSTEAQPAAAVDEVFLEAPLLSAALVDQFQKDGIIIPGPIHSSELRQQDHLRKRKLESLKFYEGIKKMKEDVTGSALVTDEDLVNAHLFDSAISVAVHLPKFIEHTSTQLHKSVHANSHVHRPQDIIAPIANFKNEPIPEEFPKTLHDLEEMHENTILAIEKYYGLDHNKKEHVGDRKRQIRHHLGIFNIE